MRYGSVDTVQLYERIDELRWKWRGRGTQKNNKLAATSTIP